jgi:hypothetical protein
MMVIVPKWMTGPEKVEPEPLTRAELASMVEFIKGGLLIVANCGMRDRIEVLHGVVKALVNGDKVSVTITKRTK